MRLLNAAVAVASALVGTLGATAAYGALNTAPVGHTEPMLEPVKLTHYLPCDPPAVLKDGVCLTTVVKTVVRTAQPVVITTVEKARSSKGKSTSTPKTHDREDGEHHDDDDEKGDDDDHDHDHGDD